MSEPKDARHVLRTLKRYCVFAREDYRAHAMWAEATLNDGSEACEHEQRIRTGEFASSETWADRSGRPDA